MEKLFIPYELALKLKELGFKFYPLGYYSLLEDNKIIQSKFYASDDFLEAPTWGQAFDWLLDKYKYWQFTFPNIHSKDWSYHIQYYDVNDGWGETFIKGGFKNQEQARLECLKKLIEIVEKLIY